jgi:predicted O-methyltransferase YrrM
MSRQTLNLTDRLYDYLLDVSLREPPLLARLREETAKVPMAEMQISPECRSRRSKASSWPFWWN